MNIQLFHYHYNILSLSLDSNDVTLLHLKILWGMFISDGLPFEGELELKGVDPGSLSEGPHQFSQVCSWLQTKVERWSAPIDHNCLNL